MDKLKLDIQKFALNPPTAGNIIDEVCLHRYHQNIKRDYAKKNSDNNFANVVVDSIRSKNMLNLLNFVSLTANGVTFTNNGNGSITINGTASADFGINFVLFKIKAGNYYLSMNESSTLPNVFYLYDHDSNVGFGNGAITLSQDYNNMGFDTWITNGTSFNNITISPQLETGSTATTYAPYQNLNPDTSGLDNGHMPTYGGFNKRSVRANRTTYSFSVPNHQKNGFIRNALVMCGDKGFMAIRWAGNNGISPTVAWSSFNSSQVSLSHSNGILTITFTSTVYGSVDVLFTN